jgi:hypothetical protein
VLSTCSTLPYSAVSTILTESADDVANTGTSQTDHWIFGRVNAQKAVNAVSACPR